MHQYQNTLIIRSVGFLASLFLTLAAYFIVMDPSYFGLGVDKAVLVILILAFLQSMVQFIFFIDLWREKGPLWNSTVFASTVLIIFIIVFFSIWIMNHLNDNMMGS